MIGTLEQMGFRPQRRYNAGYLVRVLLVPTTDVDYVLTPDENLLIPAWGIGLKPGARIFEILCRPQTATLVDSYQGDGAYQGEVSIPVLTEDDALTRWVARYEKHRWLTLAQDTLGRCYCLGRPDNGGRLAWGRQVTARNVQSLTIRTTMLHPAAQLTTLDPAVLFAEHGFDARFDLSFN